MIKNFEDVKKQLEELAPIINSFSSEAVQLKIVELVLSGKRNPKETIEKGEVREAPALKQRVRKRRSKKVQGNSKEGGAVRSSPKRSPGNGAPATLEKLVDEGFFKQKRTIKDIVDHCETNLARKFKQNEFSGKLARLVRSGVLARTKNEDGLYEYVNK